LWNVLDTQMLKIQSLKPLYVPCFDAERAMHNFFIEAERAKLKKYSADCIHAQLLFSSY